MPALNSDLLCNLHATFWRRFYFAGSAGPRRTSFRTRDTRECKGRHSLEPVGMKSSRFATSLGVASRRDKTQNLCVEAARLVFLNVPESTVFGVDGDSYAR